MCQKVEVFGQVGNQSHLLKLCTKIHNDCPSLNKISQITQSFTSIFFQLYASCAL